MGCPKRKGQKLVKWPNKHSERKERIVCLIGFESRAITETKISMCGCCVINL